MAALTVRQTTHDDAAELARLLDLFDNMGATPEQVAARMLAGQHVLTTFIGVLKIGWFPMEYALALAHCTRRDGVEQLVRHAPCR